VALDWETLVAALALIFALFMLGLVALLRDPYRHRLRVGFFVDRDHDYERTTMTETETEEPTAPEPEPEPDTDGDDTEEGDGEEES